MRYTSAACQKTEETALALLSEIKEQTFHEDIVHERAIVEVQIDVRHVAR